MSPLQLATSVDQYQRMQALTPLEIATARLNYDKASQLAPIEVAKAQTGLQQQQLDYNTQSQLDPYRISNAKNASDLDTIAAQNQALADAARRAQAADAADRPATWDREMQALKDKGNPMAGQYIGNYRGDLADNVIGAFGGGGGGTGARPGAAQAKEDIADDESFQRAVANTPLPQLQQSVGNLNRVITAFNRVRTADDLKSEVQQLQQAGIPVSQMLPGLDFSKTDPASYATNYTTVSKLIDKLARRRDIMADRVAGQAVGVPQGLPPPLVKPEKPTILGYTNKQEPILADIDPDTGKTRITYGPPGVQPRPYAGTQTFMTKQQAWLAVHPGDTQGALDFAGGRRGMTPQQMRVAAQSQAARELYDATLSDPSFQPQGGPEAWTQRRADDLYNQIATAGAAPSPGSPATGAGLTPGAHGPLGTASNPIRPTTLPPVTQRIKGLTYALPKGNFTWTGTGWLPATR